MTSWDALEPEERNTFCIVGGILFKGQGPCCFILQGTLQSLYQLWPFFLGFAPPQAIFRESGILCQLTGSSHFWETGAKDLADCKGKQTRCPVPFQYQVNNAVRDNFISVSHAMHGAYLH